MQKLICPDCRGKLQKFTCSKCKRKFKIVKTVPLLLPKTLSSFKSIEKKFYSTEFEKSTHSFEYVENESIDDCWGLLRHFSILKDEQAQILELGAGNGQYGLILKKRGFENVVITDITASGLISALDYAKNHDFSFKNSFFAVDAENLSFEDGSFDSIFMVASLHHLENIPKTVSEIKRCLKKNGLAIIAVEPNRWYFKIIRPLAKILKIRRVHIGESSVADEKTKGFTLKELKSYFREFEIVREQKVWYLTGLIYYLPDLLKRLFKLKLTIPRKIRIKALKFDRFIEKIPFIREFSFHITLIVRKP